MRRMCDKGYAGQASKSREYATFFWTLEIADPSYRAVVFTNRFVKYDAGPIAGSELCLADVCDLTGFGSTHPNSFANYEAVSILC